MVVQLFYSPPVDWHGFFVVQVFFNQLFFGGDPLDVLIDLLFVTIDDEPGQSGSSGETMVTENNR